MGHVHDAVKRHRTRIGNINDDGAAVKDINDQIRGRISERLHALGWAEDDYARIAEAWGMDRKQLRKYLVAETQTIPAELVLKMHQSGFASAHWILTGEGSQVPLGPSQAERVLEEIQKILRPLSRGDDVHLARVADDPDDERGTA